MLIFMIAMVCYTERNQLPLALKDARQGKQALFVHRWTGGSEAPPPFRGSQLIGKLFDCNRKRLIATARALGIRVIKIDRPGLPGQHIDLVGPVLQRAMARAAAK